MTNDEAPAPSAIPGGYAKMRSVSRRSFISTGSAGLALAALGMERGQADPLGIPIGLQLYTVYSEIDKDFEGTLSRIAAIGIREVELIDFPNRKPKEVRRALANAGLRAISVHLGGDDLASQPQKQIDLAGEFGVGYLICPGPLDSPMARSRPEFAAAQDSFEAIVKYLSTMTLDDWRWNAEVFNRVGERSKRAGIQFGYHNHSPEFNRFGNQVAYDDLISRTDSRYVTFEMDCGWVESSHASAVGYLRKYPGRFQLLHIKDIKRRADPGVELKMTSTEVGRGIIGWKEVFAAAPRGGVKHYFIEQEPPYERPALESVRLSYDWLHTLR
jgi:sugar phosphate isomerase/epimerase